MITKVPFAKPFFDATDQEEILQEMREVLGSGWLTSGKKVESLEEQFALYVGTARAVAVNSCTAALHSILLALDIRPGNEVIVPSDTFVATANAVLYVGAKPVFADSDPETFNLSSDDIEQKVNDKTKAIIAVHLGGNPCDMRELTEIARDHQITLLEDCAHAHGANVQGKKCGTFGTAGAFSFYSTKIMTSAEGGIVTTDDDQLAERIRRIRSHGRGGYGPVETTELGYNFRMSDLHAVLALNQMKHLPLFIRQRQTVADSYNKFFARINWVKPQLVRAGSVCTYYAYLLRLTEDAPIQRDELARRLREKGVGTSVLYFPVHTQPFYKRILDKDPNCPTSEELGRRTIALPMYNGMSESELQFVKRAWEGVVESPREEYASVN